jgi:outer membrane protein
VALAAAGFWCASPAAAEEPEISGLLTVDDCVEIALLHNDLLGQAEANVQAAKGSYWIGLRELLPYVGASAGWSYTDPAREVPVHIGGIVMYRAIPYDGTISFRARQTILSLPGIAGARSGHERLHASREELRATRDDTEVTARAQFYTLLAVIKLADVEERAVGLAQEQLRRAETLFRLGSEPRSDVLQAQVNLAEAEQAAIDRRNAVDIERGRLALVMGLDPRTHLMIDSTLVVPDSSLADHLNEWVETAMQARPELIAARHRLRAAELDVTAAKTARVPKLGADWSWRRSASSDDEWLTDPLRQTFWSITIGAEVDLLDGLSIEGRSERAKADRRLKQEVLERLGKEVALEVREAFLSVANEREKMEAAESSLALNEENLRLQQALYESGAGTLLEWDNAGLALRRARVSLIQAQISLLLAHVYLHKAIGE